jgi:hypothetical protein
MARRPRGFYAGLSFRPPAPVAAAALRALERRAQQPPSNRGMTPVGLARARQLLHRQELSPHTIDRMASFFARHEVDKQGSSHPRPTAKAVRPGMAEVVTLDCAGPGRSLVGWMLLNVEPEPPTTATTPLTPTPTQPVTAHCSLHQGSENHQRRNKQPS